MRSGEVEGKPEVAASAKLRRLRDRIASAPLDETTPADHCRLLPVEPGFIQTHWFLTGKTIVDATLRSGIDPNQSGLRLRVFYLSGSTQTIQDAQASDDFELTGYSGSLWCELASGVRYALGVIGVSRPDGRFLGLLETPVTEVIPREEPPEPLSDEDAQRLGETGGSDVSNQQAANADHAIDTPSPGQSAPIKCPPHLLGIPLDIQTSESLQDQNPCAPEYPPSPSAAPDTGPNNRHASAVATGTTPHAFLPVAKEPHSQAPAPCLETEFGFSDAPVRPSAHFLSGAPAHADPVAEATAFIEQLRRKPAACEAEAHRHAEAALHAADTPVLVSAPESRSESGGKRLTSAEAAVSATDTTAACSHDRESPDGRDVTESTRTTATFNPVTVAPSSWGSTSFPDALETPGSAPVDARGHVRLEGVLAPGFQLKLWDTVVQPTLEGRFCQAVPIDDMGQLDGLLAMADPNPLENAPSLAEMTTREGNVILTLTAHLEIEGRVNDPQNASAWLRRIRIHRNGGRFRVSRVLPRGALLLSGLVVGLDQQTLPQTAG